MPAPPSGDGRVGLGQTGERLAARFLTERGYTIIERRWRCAVGEIDLIVQDAGALAFVEVRTRRGDTYGAALESITPAKAARLMRLADAYLARHPQLATLAWRIDLVAVQLDRRGHLLEIAHVESAIEA